MNHKSVEVKEILNLFSETTRFARRSLPRWLRYTVNVDIPTAIKENLEIVMESLQDRWALLRVLNVLMFFCSRYGDVFVSQKKVACLCGCRRETVNRAIAFWAGLGVIKKFVRHKNSYDLLRYEIDPIFQDVNVNAFMWKYAPNCIKLLSFENRLSEGLLTPMFSSLEDYRKERRLLSCLLLNYIQTTPEESVFDEYNVLGGKLYAIS